ncbi:hypothetical protein LG943_04390 [Streptomonospora sp. S1-112]|uniref:Uncharacterized protein n=1 Tax=Streptomonospora mangrovi TaxID=2883123 RepID=A0A9X3NI12_9ACTN|nr:hypothetical protein [Streptomonospora mangrovi]MDA0563573.1 hypothetical protein [Streptomonospora mangrovi]
MRFAVRGAVAAALGVMAAGFLDWRAGVLVAGLTLLTYVLLDTVPRADGARSLRSLRGAGYRLLRDGPHRYLAVGPGGVYLVFARLDPVSPSRRIGGVPAERVAERAAAHAARQERVLGTEVVPVVLVTGRLPEPVVRLGRVLVARPRDAVRHILGRPEALDDADVRRLVERHRS